MEREVREIKTPSRLNFLRSRKGVSEAIIYKAILAFVGITVLFLLVANLLPVAQDAGDELANTSAPLSSLFAGNGVVFVLIMASLVLLVIKAFMPQGKGKK